LFDQVKYQEIIEHPHIVWYVFVVFHVNKIKYRGLEEQVIDETVGYQASRSLISNLIIFSPWHRRTVCLVNYTLEAII
jgi:hypothetical protein